MMSAKANFFGGLLSGAAIGLITGLLVAPSTGKQMRKKIRKKSKRYSKEAIQAVQQYLGRKGDKSLAAPETKVSFYND